MLVMPVRINAQATYQSEYAKVSLNVNAAYLYFYLYIYG